MAADIDSPEPVGCDAVQALADAAHVCSRPQRFQTEYLRAWICSVVRSPPEAMREELEKAGRIKKDEFLVPGVAEMFGVHERTVWKAIKNAPVDYVLDGLCLELERGFAVFAPASPPISPNFSTPNPSAILFVFSTRLYSSGEHPCRPKPKISTH